MARKSSLKPIDGFVQPVAEQSKINAYKPLEMAVIPLILSQDRENNVAKKNRINIKWKFKGRSRIKLDIPEGFPAGFKTDDPQVMSYTAEWVLLWLYENGLSKFYANMLYSQRQIASSKLTKLMNEVTMDELFTIGDDE